MNIQVGAGGVRLPGFLNVDIRKVEGVDLVGDAADLRGIADGTVDVLFGHALFEHLFIGHQLAALREWKRVLSPSGVIVVLAIPDFSVIAELYLKNAAGIVGERFDLHNVYRYTHGEPEHATPPVWPVWRAKDGAAPPGWIPQLHKGLFDPGYVRDLLAECELPGVIFNYAYPGEDHPLNLGFVAHAKPLPGADKKDVLKALERIPHIEKFVRLETMVIRDPRNPEDGLLRLAKVLASQRPVSLSGRIARRFNRFFSSAPAHP